MMSKRENRILWLLDKEFDRIVKERSFLAHFGHEKYDADRMLITIQVGTAFENDLLDQFYAKEMVMELNDMLPDTKDDLGIKMITQIAHSLVNNVEKEFIIKFIEKYPKSFTGRYNSLPICFTDMSNNVNGLKDLIIIEHPKMKMEYIKDASFTGTYQALSECEKGAKYPRLYGVPVITTCNCPEDKFVVIPTKELDIWYRYSQPVSFDSPYNSKRKTRIQSDGIFKYYFIQWCWSCLHDR